MAGKRARTAGRNYRLACRKPEDNDKSANQAEVPTTTRTDPDIPLTPSCRTYRLLGEFSESRHETSNALLATADTRHSNAVC
ncbi:hypothetical protein APT_01639 [Acetobacter pasteurianus NBRC 101655]|nr:hypothetical protein APT_01639 [Acetobacter pasteurianus NBRC 101655]